MCPVWYHIYAVHILNPDFLDTQCSTTTLPNTPCFPRRLFLIIPLIFWSVQKSAKSHYSLRQVCPSVRINMLLFVKRIKSLPLQDATKDADLMVCTQHCPVRNTLTHAEHEPDPFGSYTKYSSLYAHMEFNCIKPWTPAYICILR